jgi:hypothetical protein
MHTTCWRRAHFWRTLPFLLAGIFAATPVASQAAPQTQPTDSQDAEVLDHAWQHASSNYDSQRVALLKEVRSAIIRGPYRADWQSLQKYEVPDWYKDAKFGIFIHWGVYSVPAFGSEWYPRNMYRPDTEEYKHHLATYGSQTKFGYKDFIPMFQAEHYDPVAFAWAPLPIASSTISSSAAAAKLIPTSMIRATLPSTVPPTRGSKARKPCSPTGPTLATPI